MGIHDGHRDRLRESFTEHGLDSLTDINALELLLFYSIPRKDTNEIAHRLLDHFGSLHDVFSASIEELTEVPGIGYNSAVLISLIPQMMRKVEISRTSEIKKIDSTKDAVEYLLPRFINEPDEVLLMICLDSSRNIICCREVARGTVASVDADYRRITEMALRHKAIYVIISHNHPNGVPVPSREDDQTTLLIHKALKMVGIRLEDHIVVAGNEYFSFLQSGVMHSIRL